MASRDARRGTRRLYRRSARRYDSEAAVSFRFAKYEGLGNDFVVVSGQNVTEIPLGPPEAAVLCDRHLGVGADGVLLTGVAAGRPYMRILNADGSEPEMCGNGLRCVALHLIRTGMVTDRSFVVDTASGPHGCEIVGEGEVGHVEVEMRVPSLEPVDVPVEWPGRMIDAPVSFAGITLRITAVSMGNPHAVTFDELDADVRAELGPRIGGDRRFPHRVNVGFARVLREGELELAVYERGVGWTRACGTGACAAAVAAVETGRAKRHEAIAVDLPGGRLVVRVGERGERVRMLGPARHVFDGELDLERLLAPSNR